jgi:NAD(P)-dependent dehydrogenase (short-subunit alcohol dehydrogenase family)
MPRTHVIGHWLARHNIRVNCINSGLLRSGEAGIPARGTTPSRDPGDEERKRHATPLARPSLFEETANAALFLAGDEASYVNGSVITLDGGRTSLAPGTF